MTCAEKQEELLKIFQRVTVLSERNGCRVYKVRHKALGRELVLRILPKQNPVYKTLCGIRQKNLTEVYEVFTLSNGMLVLEKYIDGLTVAEITETGRYRKKGAVRVLRALCDGLTVLHENGIMHRDIKPENIIIDKSGNVVLIDFSTARRISAKAQDTEIMGTVGYAAPEQLGLAQSDARTDIFALGVLLNVLLTGDHPSVQLAKGSCGRIVRKCTDINMDKRYQTAKQLKRSLWLCL